MSDRYIPFGAHEAAAQGWGLLTHGDLQARDGRIDKALECFRMGLLSTKYADEDARASSKIVSICLARSPKMARESRSDAIALLEGALDIVGDDAERQSALAELRGG